MDAPQSRHRVNGFEDILGIGRIEIEVRSREISKSKWVFKTRGDEDDLRRDWPSESADSFESLFDRTNKRFRLELTLV